MDKYMRNYLIIWVGLMILIDLLIRFFSGSANYVSPLSYHVCGLDPADSGIEVIGEGVLCSSTGVPGYIFNLIVHAGIGMVIGVVVYKIRATGRSS